MSAPRTIYLVPARVSARPITAQRAPVHISRVHRPIKTNSTCLKRPVQPEPVSSDDPLEMLLNGGSGQGPPRKRERLNHLTSEEKMDRRKLKNRVAAQTARDRKKARSQRLEEVVRQLLDENQRLREENCRLKMGQKQGEVAVESAAFISGPQPRAQVTSLLPLFLLLLTSFPKMRSTISSRISRATSISTNSRLSCRSIIKKRTPSLWKAPLSRPRKWDVP